MSQTVFLHIGAPKTGTTFLQSVLFKNRSLLQDRGVWLPGRTPSDHFKAGFDLRDRPRPGSRGAWWKLAESIRACPYPEVVVSDERLAACTAEEAQRAVDSLAPAEVRVVYGTRSMTRLLPAEWQQHVKGRDQRGFDAWLSDILDDNRPKTQWFWMVQGTQDVLRRWSEAVPPSRINVLTVPRPGSAPDLLWTRFASILATNPDGVDLSVTSNPSVGVEGTEVIRRLNQALPTTFPQRFQIQLKRDLLADRILAHRTNKLKISVPQEWREWIEAYSEALIGHLRASDYTVVGDLEDLRPLPEAGKPTSVHDSAVTDAAIDGMVGLLTRLGKMRDERRRLMKELEAVRAERDDLREHAKTTTSQKSPAES